MAPSRGRPAATLAARSATTATAGRRRRSRRHRPQHRRPLRPPPSRPRRSWRPLTATISTTTTTIRSSKDSLRYARQRRGACAPAPTPLAHGRPPAATPVAFDDVYHPPRRRSRSPFSYFSDRIPLLIFNSCSVFVRRFLLSFPRSLPCPSNDGRPPRERETPIPVRERYPKWFMGVSVDVVCAPRRCPPVFRTTTPVVSKTLTDL